MFAISDLYDRVGCRVGCRRSPVQIELVARGE